MSASSKNEILVAELPQRLLTLASEHDEPSAFLEEALGLLASGLDADAVAVLRGEPERWSVLGRFGEQLDPPLELAADVLDREALGTRGAWTAAPLPRQLPRSAAFVAHAHAADPATVAAAARWLDAALSMVSRRDGQARQIRRLLTILEITSQWSQTQRTADLLQQMAEASTRLLQAERASIFLWDKRNKMLIGRPALGVAGDELRIADDVGVVGQVLRSGEMRRVDAAQAAREIDHRVDREVKFRTRNLLCAPLRTPRAELLGAFEVMNKIGGDFTEEDEIALSELALHAAVALENTHQYEELLRARNQLADQAAAGVRLIGKSPVIEALRSTVGRIADTDLAILILGENGTGKEVVSQMIHYLSRRRHQPFVAVNCAALTETLLESELFGHEKGAFTDAHEARAGKFELANRGTLFLDEIGDMSPGGQAKLLRVLEEKVVVRVGGSRPISTDARVIAATNQNLARMVREKRFREDLFFRLNVVTLDLPPLRERADDVMLLAEHFLQDFCVKARRRPPRFTAAARKRLRDHSWPGNIRELRNLMERLAYLFPGDEVDAQDLAFVLPPEPAELTAASLRLPLNEATRRFQVRYVEQQIDRARGNMTDAAEKLGLHRSNLYRKMRQLGMTAGEDE